MRFKYDKAKSARLKRTRGLGFEEVQAIWSSPYYVDQRTEVPEQWRAIGWVGGRLYSVIFEEREDTLGEYVHLVTLWRATKAEEQLYAQNS